MHPLQELELFYLDIRRQVEAGQIHPAAGMQQVTDRRIIDASGVVWGVDVSRSQQTRAAFLAAPPNQPPQPADPSQFTIAAQPIQPPAQTQFPQATQPSYPTFGAQGPSFGPQGGSFGTQGPSFGPQGGSFWTQGTSATQQPFGQQQFGQQPFGQQPFGPGPQQFPPGHPGFAQNQNIQFGQTATAQQQPSTVEGQGKGRIKRPKKPAVHPEQGQRNVSAARLADAAANFQLTPKTVTALVVAFIVLAVGFMFFNRGDKTAPTTPSSTAVQVDVTSNQPEVVPVEPSSPTTSAQVQIAPRPDQSTTAPAAGG